ncbi:MAG: hypothetical protein H6559_00320 [Lewinellaceae bacterium]|nr:hypothetical protein [Lewinellaceae bacterium]
MKRLDNQTFKDWTDFLKKSFGISINAIGKRAGLTKSQMNAYRNGPTLPPQECFAALAAAFPELRARAEEAGLNPGSGAGARPSQEALLAKIEKLEKEVGDLEKNLASVDHERREVQKALNKANAIIVELMEKYGIVGGEEK